MNSLNVPTIAYETLPEHIWHEAYRQSLRSTLGAFKTGAVVFQQKNYNVVGKGCSHHINNIENPVVHAEQDALNNSRYEEGESIVIVSIGKAENFAYSSRPCLACAERLYKRKIEYAYFAERMNNGDWIINCERPTDLLERARRFSIHRDRYARSMRIPPP